MRVDKTTIGSFRASLARASGAPDFFDRFYERFIGGSEDMAAIFRNKDMDRIKEKLQMTLEMLCDSAEDKPGLGMYLDLLGKIHQGMRISPRHFTLWRDALTATAAECDPQFDPVARAAWDAVIEDIIAKMGETPEHSAPGTHQ